jgi:hypothetical protein
MPVAVVILLPILSAIATAAETSPAIEFNRDVRPILADHCFQCHGPDAAQRKADLRLDLEPRSDRDNGPVLIAGQPDKSELYRRVTSTDADEQMPPPGKGRRLTETEISTLRQWILSGAKSEKHWSLLPFRHPDVAGTLRVPSWPTSALDAFILARLDREGLTPSPPADRPTLLRRVSFALTGLPPSIDELEQYAGVSASPPLSLSPPLPLTASASPDWYERYIDKLLASPRYGERMAVPWLDAARYADTSGYQSDGERHMWRWRDWVIEALNANMPFDQFTIEQLAGDLLPNATLDQKIATGFNRNHRGNAEGGIIPEEYAAEYVADRVETTATVWLGLTLGCCRCHDHKYDPFTQKDFYSLFAFFNNIPEKGRAIKIGNSPPYIVAPTRLQEQELARLLDKYVQTSKKANSLLLEDDYREWQKRSKDKGFGNWFPTENLTVHVGFNGDAVDRAGYEKGAVEGNPRFVSGQLDQSVHFDGKTSLAYSNAADFGFFDNFTISAWVKIDIAGHGTIVSRMADVPEGEGFQLAIVAGKLQFNLVKRWLDDALRVQSERLVPFDGWHHIAATYDGSRVADGVALYFDGEQQPTRVLLDELNQSFATKEPFRIGGGGGPNSRFRGSIDEVRIYNDALAQRDIAMLATPESIDELLSGKTPQVQSSKLREYYEQNQAPAEFRAAQREMLAVVKESTAFEEKLPTVMVMEELPTPRETHILLRGQYDKPGDPVLPNTPAELPPLNDSSLPLPLGEGRGEGSQTGSNPESKPKSTLNLEPGAVNSTPNRLDLAKWLVSQENPLTSRVIVNRAWQLHFGTGLVKTAEDFGRQGEWPSHPDLLDHLASEFQSTWDVKRLHRTILTSAAYRQSSSAELGARSAEQNSDTPRSALPAPRLADPENRLLSRGPRLRLSAEMLRDQALFASGQLVEQLGGPSVKPLQPPGLWSELTGGDDYKPGTGQDLVRRSLYTFWKRTIPPPTLSTFDSPTREACTVRDSRTNTPLQALALLNEPTFVSASRALAHRIIHETQTPEDRLTLAFLYILSRSPTSQELPILSAALQRHLQRTPTDEPAAYTLLCTTILNLDEAITSQ